MAKKNSKGGKAASGRQQQSMECKHHILVAAKHNDAAIASSRNMYFFAIIVIATAVLVNETHFLPWMSSASSLSSSSSIDQLLQDWELEGKVAIQEFSIGRGVVATQDIAKGEVILSVPTHDLAAEARQHYPRLQPLIEQSLKGLQQLQLGNGQKDESNVKRYTSIALLLLVHLGSVPDQSKRSPWKSYLQTLPSNVSNTGFYWTMEERQCIVTSGVGVDTFIRELETFRAVVHYLGESFEPLLRLREKHHQAHIMQQAEWLYLMSVTRSFGGNFLPIVDMANHSPLQSVSPFMTKGVASLIATQDIASGTQVYNSYGILSPLATAERYGFVDMENTAYIEVPSIREDLLQHVNTKNVSVCTNAVIAVFGNVTEQIMQAEMPAHLYPTKQKLSQSTYMKPFRPLEITYACVRVLLQTEEDEKVADYMSEKLKEDFERYNHMANDERCQSSQGNYPLIRQANAAMAKGLHAAYEVARSAAEGAIPYPDIPTYIKHRP